MPKGTWKLGVALAVAALGCSPIAAQTGAGPVLLDGLFQDRAVFQRGRPIPVWGEARPGEEVTLQFGGAIVKARADAAGQWSAELPAKPAGGPYELLVTTSAGGRQALSDILVGDVILCSGQSNMELDVARALNSWGEVNNAGDDKLRLLTVGHDSSFTPLSEFQTPVRWQAASPGSVADFSALCYFTGRELRASQDVPIGLIDASWGGTAINAWRSEQAVERQGTELDALKVLRIYRRDPGAGSRAWGKVWQDWWSRSNSDRPWEPGAGGEWTPVPSLTPWETWGDPALAQFNGMLWYRTSVNLTAEQAKSPASISVGWVDEVDQSWVNGVAVGSNYAPGGNRTYDIPAGTLKAGANTIVINALDTYGAGGLAGPEELRAIHFADGSSVPLSGPWQYRVVPNSVGTPPRAPWETNAGLSTIYNGMIAPMGRYGLRAVAWYQGESDTGMADVYAGKLTSLMQDWRTQFRVADLPFLVVQLADWGSSPAQPVESGFADVRDQQRRAVAADANAGLVVAIDLGERTDIHPANKQDIARRMARAARHVVYGEQLTPSGPEVAGARSVGDTVVVDFRNSDGALVTYSAARPIGFELCGPADGSCRFVDARVQGSSVTLERGDGPADRVRFCWGDSPVCNLYDQAGLPAGPFEVAVR